MKVVSWNIVHGIDIDGAVEALRSDERLAESDVLLLQEMDEIGVRAVADALGLHYVYAPASVHPKSGRDFGNAVLTPTPLTEPTVVELPHKAPVGGQPRIAISTTSRIAGRDVALCTTHTEIPAMSTAKRYEQFTVVATTAAAHNTDQVVVGGDFNTVTAKGIRTLVGLFDEVEFRHVSIDAVPTLRRVGQHFTLDHLFARGLWPVESGVVRGLGASDHAPIWAVLEASETESRPVPDAMF